LIIKFKFFWSFILLENLHFMIIYFLIWCIFIERSAIGIRAEVKRIFTFPLAFLSLNSSLRRRLGLTVENLYSTRQFPRIPSKVFDRIAIFLSRILRFHARGCDHEDPWKGIDAAAARCLRINCDRSRGHISLRCAFRRTTWNFLVRSRSEERATTPRARPRRSYTYVCSWRTYITQRAEFNLASSFASRRAYRNLPTWCIRYMRECRNLLHFQSEDEEIFNMHLFYSKIVF